MSTFWTLPESYKLGIDRYKRYIAECFINNQSINELMVRNGWAIAYRYYSLDFIDDEEIAKVGRELGMNVPFVRPKHLSEDSSSTRETLKHAVIQMEKINNRKLYFF